MRLFVAVDVPEAVKQACAALMTDLPGASWSKTTQLHVTLRFLGEMPDAEVPALLDRLAALRAPTLTVRARGVGRFPGRGPASVLWVGLEPARPLAALKAAVDALLPADPEAARAFVPHLTVARFRRPARGQPLRDWLAAHAAFATQPWPVTSCGLWKSDLGPNGATHTRLRDYPLQV